MIIRIILFIFATKGTKAKGTMKKVLSIAIVLLTAMAAFAQNEEPVLIQNGFSTSGTMNMFLETTDINDVAKADDGAKWHLELKNDTITFWIDVPPMGLYRLSETKWKKDDAALVLNKMDNGLRVYIVADIQFRGSVN